MPIQKKKKKDGLDIGDFSFHIKMPGKEKQKQNTKKWESKKLQKSMEWKILIQQRAVTISISGTKDINRDYAYIEKIKGHFTQTCNKFDNTFNGLL